MNKKRGRIYLVEIFDEDTMRQLEELKESGFTYAKVFRKALREYLKRLDDVDKS